VFEDLVGGVKQDIERINSVRSNQFGFHRDGAYISVYQKAKDEEAGKRFVAITCTETSIKTEYGGKVLQATLMVNDEGKCCLKADGKERKIWQFRKDALEDLFFGDGLFR
jgi:hypothetical protein